MYVCRTLSFAPLDHFSDLYLDYGVVQSSQQVRSCTNEGKAVPLPFVCKGLQVRSRGQVAESGFNQGLFLAKHRKSSSPIRLPHLAEAKKTQSRKKAQVPQNASKGTPKSIRNKDQTPHVPPVLQARTAPQGVVLLHDPNFEKQ